MMVSKTSIKLYIMLFALLVCPDLFANNMAHSNISKYADEETRPIKSLSAEDIAELKTGGGWGLAKAAELNGVPGPAHLLELKNEIPLKTSQIKDIQALYNSMKADAIALGKKFILLEQELEIHFQNRTITDPLLRSYLLKIEKVRKDLRYTHLSTHLSTIKILSPDQIQKYNSLRGYDSKDPCNNVPKGHNSELWKKHNGCS